VEKRLGENIIKKDLGSCYRRRNYLKKNIVVIILAQKRMISKTDSVDFFTALGLRSTKSHDVYGQLPGVDGGVRLVG